MLTTVIKLSICQCGFPLFTDTVQLGDEYEVDRAMTVPNSGIICGGCKLDGGKRRSRGRMDADGSI